LELPQVRELIDAFDPIALVYPWRHPDPRMDRLHADVLAMVGSGGDGAEDRADLFRRVWALTAAAGGMAEREPVALAANGRSWEPIPHLSEPWYC
jgi:hypothetical protein